MNIKEELVKRNNILEDAEITSNGKGLVKKVVINGKEIPLWEEKFTIEQVREGLQHLQQAGSIFKFGDFRRQIPESPEPISRLKIKDPKAPKMKKREMQEVKITQFVNSLMDDLNGLGRGRSEVILSCGDFDERIEIAFDIARDPNDSQGAQTKKFILLRRKIMKYLLADKLWAKVGGRVSFNLHFDADGYRKRMKL